MIKPSTNTVGELTVLYDGACPLCRREIGLYRGLQPLAPIAWTDVSDPASLLPAGADRATYLARFHVQRPDGTLSSGAAGFIALWDRLPGWRWLARLGRLPGMTATMEHAYRFFLRFRPRLQRFASRFEPAGVGECDCAADNTRRDEPDAGRRSGRTGSQ